jgi:peptide/nickel transport system substrate-binding protein
MTQSPLDRLSQRLLASRSSRRALLGQGAAIGMAVPTAHAVMRPGIAAAEGGVVTVGISATPTTMDLSKPDWVSWWGTNYLYDTLLSTDDNETFIPLLAESWETAPDGLEWTLHLRQGVTFHDGTPFNAAAVKFNYDRILNDKDNGWNTPFSEDIESVEVVDDATVKFHLKRNDVFFAFAVLADWGAIQVSPKAIEEYGADYAKHPSGTGPFLFQSFEADAQIDYTPNPNYWGGAPSIEGVRVRIIPEASTRNIELQAGTLDIAFDMQVQDVQELEGSDVVIEQRFGPQAHFIALNVSTGPTAELAVRKAIALATDRDAMLSQMLENIPEKSWSGVASVSPYYDQSVPTIEYNPDEAKRLLEEAGWVAGDDGMRSRGDSPLKVIILSTDYATWNQFNQIIQEQLRAVGIDSDLQTLEWGSYLDKWRDTDEWHVSFHNQGGGFHTTNIAYASVNPDDFWSINHLKRSTDPELMAVADRLRELAKEFNVTADPEVRKNLSVEYQRIFQENQLTVWLWHQPWLFAVNPRVKDYSIRYNAVLLEKATV